jgi:deoxyribodipyrimidine photolyase-related protein
MKTLRLILGDQLHTGHSWFRKTDPDTLYCLFEMRQETDYTGHHIQKVIGFFAAMRRFAEDLESCGHTVVYFKINDPHNRQSLTENLERLIAERSIGRFEYLFPDEYRLDRQLREFCDGLDIPYQALDTEHFYTARDELAEFFKGKKQFLMESFYRSMRKKHDLLMDGGNPAGGKWNYDASNRKRWKGSPDIPAPKSFRNRVESVVADIEKAGIRTIGRFERKTFDFPICRDQALEQLDAFCDELLPHFGDFEDAMHSDEPFLFHSRLSFALNLKLITPQETVEAALSSYKKSRGRISLSQVEGFMRQILGWREYMRGMYWMRMPGFKNENHLNNTNPLPGFFWTGETRMNCLKHAVGQSLDHAYAHHIQRLMVTGNYALLTQTDPDEVDVWYLGIYIDAVEWVQLPNTRGMSQFADGGTIATKPYVSSGSYIHKMSNYCRGCPYDPKEKITDDACPFNSLYWNFLDEKRPLLAENHRMRMMYSVLDKIDGEQLRQMKKRARRIIANPDQY